MDFGLGNEAKTRYVARRRYSAGSSAALRLAARLRVRNDPASPKGYPATLKNFAEVNAEAGGASLEKWKKWRCKGL